MKNTQNIYKHKTEKETKFYDATKKYDFGLYKADPSVNIITKTEIDF